MRKILLLVFLLGCNKPQEFTSTEVYKVSMEDETPHIRLLVLKHSIEFMADEDADLAINAAKDAANCGLKIKNIGNHYIDNNGKVRFFVWNDISKLQEFVSQQMKVGAEAGDTVIVFTIGHGMYSGSLQNLGQRSLVMHAIADAAEENQQRTLWWQLSCHACAQLPNISVLPEEQQRLFSMYASSKANDVSSSGVQGGIMKRVFMAMAYKSSAIDPDHNSIVTGKELKSFLDNDPAHHGEFLFMQSLDNPIFGFGTGLANQIPIIDRNNPQKIYSKDYIPNPKL
jgi:hypothetical protein